MLTLFFYCIDFNPVITALLTYETYEMKKSSFNLREQEVNLKNHYHHHHHQMDEDLVNEKARPWISLLDSLQTLGIEEELPIPQIVVFGDQSSGKSSLLESISGLF